VEAVEYLAGRYRLIERLGAGGMSVVWRAYDEVLVRPVAVKVLASRLASDPDSRERIRAEARAAARLSHPYITSVYDFGESPLRGGEPMPFVVMELVDGKPLDELLDEGPLPWQLAVETCAQVASALAAVHARGLVHRDVKPANVMLTAAGAKVVDFGISAIAGDSTERGRQVLGTPAYIAPERLDGGLADAACDVYALGLVLYRALTGSLPWDAETTTQMLSAHCYVPPEPLPRVAGLPAAVARLCERCLDKDPARRPSSADLARELAEAAGIRVPLVGVLAVGSATVRQGADEHTTLDGERRARVVTQAARRLLPRNRTGRVAALGAVLVAASVTLAMCTDSSPTRRDPVAQAAAPPAADGPAIDPRVGCQVTYATRSDAAGIYAVDVKLTNTGDAAVTGWRLEFAYPAAQQVVAVTPGRWEQQAAQVVVQGDEELAAGGGALALTLVGSYAGANPMPTAFALNGMTCQVLVSGLAAPVDTSVQAGGPGAGGGGGGGNSGPGGGGSNSGPGKGEDGPRKPRKPKGD